MNNIMELYEICSAEEVNTHFSKRISQENVRMQITNEIQEIALKNDCEEDVEAFGELLEKLMEFEDSKKVISEKWFNIVNNCYIGIYLIPILARDDKVKKEIIENPLLVVNYTDYYDFGEVLETLEQIDDSGECIKNLLKEYTEIKELVLGYGEEETFVRIILRNKVLSDKEKEQCVRDILQTMENPQPYRVIPVYKLCKDTVAR